MSVLTIPGDLDAVTNKAGLAVDLDAIVKVLLEVSTVKDTVGRWLGVVDGELVLGGGALGGSDFGGLRKKRRSWE